MSPLLKVGIFKIWHNKASLRDFYLIGFHPRLKSGVRHKVSLRDFLQWTQEFFNQKFDFKYVGAHGMTVVHTFVTTYGVANAKHKSIVYSEVTMDDLFNS